jgi:hypothetical protein
MAMSIAAKAPAALAACSGRATLRPQPVAAPLRHGAPGRPRVAGAPVTSAPARPQRSRSVGAAAATARVPAGWGLTPPLLLPRSVVTAARGSSSEPWWEKDSAPNMKQITTVQELVDALVGVQSAAHRRAAPRSRPGRRAPTPPARRSPQADAGDRLVIVDIYAKWCNACRALYPKVRAAAAAAAAAAARLQLPCCTRPDPCPAQVAHGRAGRAGPAGRRPPQPVRVRLRLTAPRRARPAAVQDDARAPRRGAAQAGL